MSARTAASVALAVCLSAGTLVSTAHADPPSAVAVTATGFWLTLASQAGRTAPGCTLPQAPGDLPGAAVTVIARDDAAGWALIRTRTPPDAGIAAVHLIADAFPVAGNRVFVGAPGTAVQRPGDIDQATARSVVLRMEDGRDAAAGDAVLDPQGRLVGLVVSSHGGTVDVVPAQLAEGDVRDASSHAIPVCGSTTTRPRVTHVSMAPRACPATPVPRDVQARVAALVGPSLVTAGGGHAHGVVLQGDGFLAVPANAVPGLRRGCDTPMGVRGTTDPVAAVLHAVDAASGLALLRADLPSTARPLAVAVDPPARCSPALLLLAEGPVVPGLVQSADPDSVTVTVDTPLAEDTVLGLPVVDDHGHALGLVRRASGTQLDITPLGRLHDEITRLGDPRVPPVCQTVTASGAVPLTDPPPLPDGALRRVSTRNRAVAVHVATDAVYATTADRLRDVASGCIVHRSERLDDSATGELLSGEVLDVNATANLALYHIVPDHPDALPPREESPPLVIADARPAPGTTVYLATRTDADAVSAQAMVDTSTTEDLWMHLTGAGDAALEIPEGAAVLDTQGRLVGLVDRALSRGTPRRLHARAAAVLRAMLPSLRRDETTPTCFPAYGASLGSVVSATVQLGISAGTHGTQGITSSVAGGVLWFNTWYFHADLGLRLNPVVLPRLALGGGPVVFRTGGDGEMGLGLHLEVEPAFNDPALATDTDPGAQRGLYGVEIQGIPYLSRAVGLTFSLALGLAQYGNFEQAHFGFGGVFQLGGVFGSLRHDR